MATLKAQDSKEVLVAGLVNAEATVNYLRQQNPPTVVLVASHPTGDEDVACAEYMRHLLGGEGVSYANARERTLNARAAKNSMTARTRACVPRTSKPPPAAMGPAP